MLKVTIIAVGKLKEKYLKDASDEYCKRLGGYCNLEIVEMEPQKLPPKPTDGQIAAALESEGERILKKIPAGAKVISLCIEGVRYTSEKLSELITNTAVNGYSGMTFIIGGSYGLSGKVKQRSDIRLSMSDMTFPHQLARIMLLEQIYRAFTIAEGSRYHK
ncbi:MAG TPA: 23S rRNA (pseudouridine(1915)-N(3))-methyltransferase RlmH [Clostridiales bacterium]|nr:23S rRNA (pseudouridine(1915)-N(3))-methyltransferase RlmH [Clostridiales bacterium]